MFLGSRRRPKRVAGPCDKSKRRDEIEEINMDRSRAIWKFVFCLCVTSLCGSLAHAQYQATVQGTVLDPKGAAVGGATVTLMNQDTKVTNTTTTTNVGFYL